MYLVSEGEMLHRKEFSAERIGKLSLGRYLPVKVPAEDIYRKDTRPGLTGIHLHYNFIVRELKLGIDEPEVLWCVRKLQKTCNGKRLLLEKVNFELLEAGGGDPINKRFQISANTSEHKPAEVRKRYVCRDWHMH